MVEKPTALWVRFLKAKYKAGCGSIPILNRFPNESMIWRSICNPWNFILKGSCWRIGDGASIRIWTDCWLKSGVVLKDLLNANASDVNLNATIQDVSSRDGSWSFDSFSGCFPTDVVNEIAGFHSACPELGNDRLIWNSSHDGSFSVKSGYGVIRDFPTASIGSNWRNLWHWRGPTRAKYFLWLAVKGGLKTNYFLWERGLNSSSLCSVCGSHDESTLHIMCDCPKVQRVWNLLLKPSRFRPLRSDSLVDWIFSNISSKGSSNGGLPWHLIFGVYGMLGMQWFLEMRLGTLIKLYPPSCI
ncbi:Reverse transcriptase zinc-binding domain [Sesbania bispinosa]|nr:Reverse transcriptase zinc-binding domain [Sesbania bispinosa]